MEIRAALDRFSELPKEVIDEILTNIPIRDAVRTSVLSRNWRYKWMSIPETVFENRSIAESGSGIQDDTRLVNAVNHVLLLHNGVISKFEVHFAKHGFSSDVSRWILALSRRSTVNHMALQFEEKGPYQLPDCLFSCQSLRVLILQGCILRLPPLFKGLSLLAHLVLCYMNLSNETFESLLPKLPLLKELAVLHCDSLTHINIRAPNLDYLAFDSICRHINFLHTPKLTDIDIRIWIPQRPSTCRLAEILKKLADVTNVAISQPIMKYSSSDAAPRRLNVIYQKLKSVKLDINFTDKRQLVAMLCLCRSSPYLEELSLKALWGGPSIRSDDFWKGKLHREEEGDIFGHLKTVKLTGFKGVRLDVETVQFILLNAVVLKSISIKWGISVPMNNGLLRLLEGMMRFKRASSEAEVIFSHP